MLNLLLYKRRAGVVEAVQFTRPDAVSIAEWCGAHIIEDVDRKEFYLKMKDGGEARIFDYIVKETNGEFKVLFPDSFVALYSSVLPRA